MGSSRRFKLEPTVRNLCIKSNSVAATARFEGSQFGEPAFFSACPGDSRWHHDCLNVSLFYCSKYQITQPAELFRAPY
jgi:hypothetical protein